MKIGITVFVSDPVAAFKFYTEILGFKEKLFLPGSGYRLLCRRPNPTAHNLCWNESQCYRREIPDCIV
ncbi:MAG TPA: VOC family protein [Cyclobacteriaceae bacterium]|nr:VOC family protein [Cyclobacteriaceae bacterium]